MALHGFFTDEKERQALRDRIVVLEDVEEREQYYREKDGPGDYSYTFQEMKVRNWDGDVRYLILEYSDEFTIVVSPYSYYETAKQELWEDEYHDYVFSGYEESYPGHPAASNLTHTYVVLSEAWSTPYYELLRKMVNSFEEEPKFRVITLCGSTRFKEEFLTVQKRLTLEGNIVISVGLFGHSGDNEVWEPGTKEMLDEMHRKKIDMSNEIFVINKDGYIGESTLAEIEYARKTNKSVRYLEPNESGVF